MRIEPVPSVEMYGIDVTNAAGGEALPTPVGKVIMGFTAKAPSTNTGIIYVGFGEVTTASFPLGPGDGIFIPHQHPNQFKALASVNDEDLALLYT